MSDINLKDAILKVTLGNIVQQFTEKDLQKEMPIFMQDIDADTKELIDTYQLYLSDGNFSEAENYRNAHPELETRIWDSFKANSFMAYASYIYLYAKGKNQQCILSETIPPEGNGDDVLGQVEGDIWFRIDGIKDDIINTTPFQKQADGTYKEFAVAPKLEFANTDDIEEACDASDLTHPKSLINVENLKCFKEKIDSKIDNTVNETNEKFDKLIEESNSNIEKVSAKLGTQCIFSLSGTTLTITPK